MDPILEALGIAEYPAPDSLKKLLNDGLVLVRAQELMAEQFAAEVIRRMHPVERHALLKRISPPASPAHTVAWIVQGGIHSGKAQIVGKCGRCGQDVTFVGKPDEAAAVKWAHCVLGPSTIPAAVIEEYRPRFNFTM